jgi:outer membrane protein assembly factor BamB
VALTMDDTNSSIYLTSGTTVSRLDPVTGAVLKVRDFSTVTPTRPIVPRVKGGAANEVVIGGSDGYVYGLDPVTLTTTWSRSVKRSTCSTDSIEATPVVQRWDASDANFQAARTQDLMILGTSYGCSTTTANKVIAIDGSNGNIVWSHNSTGTYAIDKIGGLAVDYGRNLVYVTAYLTDPTRTQETVFALRTTDGGRVWYRTLGSMIAEPVLANGGLYVATVAGVLYKLDPSSGNTIWQSTITAGGAQIVRLAAEGSTGRVYVPDTAGGLHAVNDQCATSSLAWTTTLSGSLVSTTPAILGSVLYVGGKDGRVYQLGAADGASQSYATVSGGAATSFDPIIYLDGSSTRLLASAGGVIKKLCIPWAADHSDKALLMVPAAVDPDASAPDAAVASVERGRSDATKARADDDRRVGGE